MYWTQATSGANVLKMDKFGRGFPVEVAGDLANPAAVRLFHPRRYNTSISNPCQDSCSHLCVLVPNGYKCVCPANVRTLNKKSCDASIEAPKAEPLVCRCRNGGTCDQADDSGEPACICEENFTGRYCDVGRDQTR